MPARRGRLLLARHLGVAEVFCGDRPRVPGAVLIRTLPTTTSAGSTNRLVSRKTALRMTARTIRPRRRPLFLIRERVSLWKDRLFRPFGP
jgi:hypothetical protein